jgi:hypothetical protein
MPNASIFTSNCCRASFAAVPPKAGFEKMRSNIFSKEAKAARKAITLPAGGRGESNGDTTVSWKLR